MPAWEIACLTDGWVDGCCYGGNTGSEMRDKLGHKLVVLSQATHFVLHPRTQALPPNYRLATRHDVAMYKQFMWEVVPSGEVAYLEDGWVDSGYLQCLTGPDKREVLANQVGILMPSRVLCLQPLSTPFDPHYRLATRQDVKRNMQSLCEVMPAWEVAHLSDGWVEGIAYGSKIGADWRQGLTHKLGFLDTTIPVMQEPGIDVVLDPTGELECCLATALTKAQLRQLSTFAPVADQEQQQKIRELCAMWDMDLMLHGMAHMKLFEHEDHCISLRCNGITGECRKQVLDEQGARCMDDYYQIDVESNGQMYASVFIPVGKSVGAGATIAGPSAKKTKLQQQLNAVEKQIFDLETSLVSSSERPYSVFKGYGGLVPGNKRKATEELPERIFSDSSTKA
ncbi:hypothetical protein WJX79_001476 [Trebouxia sp. C0005]